MERPPGAQLHDAIAERLNGQVELREVKCLAVCDRGCTAAISAPGKWTWLLGGLGLRHVDDLLTYARLYRESVSGTVMPSKRPVSLMGIMIGRIPAAVFSDGKTS